MRTVTFYRGYRIVSHGNLFCIRTEVDESLATELGYHLCQYDCMAVIDAIHYGKGLR